jgi:hypothetical protein
LTSDELKASNERDKKADVILSDDPRKKWAQLNRGRNQANKHRHYANNKNRYKENHQRYNQEHKVELNAKKKEWYQDNLEYARMTAKERRRRAYAENPEKIRQANRDYRARKKVERQGA